MEKYASYIFYIVLIVGVVALSTVMTMPQADLSGQAFFMATSLVKLDENVVNTQTQCTPLPNSKEVSVYHPESGIYTEGVYGTCGMIITEGWAVKGTQKNGDYYVYKYYPITGEVQNQYIIG